MRTDCGPWTRDQFEISRFKNVKSKQLSRLRRKDYLGKCVNQSDLKAWFFPAYIYFMFRILFRLDSLHNITVLIEELTPSALVGGWDKMPTEKMPNDWSPTPFLSWLGKNSVVFEKWCDGVHWCLSNVMGFTGKKNTWSIFVSTTQHTYAYSLSNLSLMRLIFWGQKRVCAVLFVFPNEGEGEGSIRGDHPELSW